MALQGKVLIVRFSSMGDIVTTTHIPRLLKTQGSYEVHYICKEQFSGILQGNPFIDKIISISKNIGEVLPELKEEEYDYVIDLHRNLRSLRLKLALRKPSLNVNKLNFKRFLFVKTKWDLLPKKHFANRCIDALKPLNIEDDGKGLEYKVKCHHIFDDGEEFLETEENILGLVLGAAHYTKRMPENLLRDICRKWRGKIALIGGPQEKEIGKLLEEEFRERVVNFAGELSIDESVYLLDKTSVIITGDTGMMHFASAQSKPLVLVWGSTHPSFGMTPYYRSGQDVRYENAAQEISCRPCSKFGKSACPKGHFKCMAQQDANSIVEKAVSLL